MYYRFHPLRTHSLPVVRLYDFHDEAYYVVRRADGRPLARIIREGVSDRDS
jgi:hypothetical protein